MYRLLARSLGRSGPRLVGALVWLSPCLGNAAEDELNPGVVEVAAEPSEPDVSVPAESTEPAESTQPPAIDPNDADPTVLPEFERQLSPYGKWVEDPVYGRVWVADARYVGDDFAPYVTGGHWELTQSKDWIWQTDYAFGDAVFHYGRWVWLSSRHWGWVPGARYAHAWVDYRVPRATGAPYVGWSPAPPRWIWRDGVAVRLSSLPARYYVFVSSSYVFYPGLPGYVLTDGYYVDYAYLHTRPFYAPFGYHPYYWHTSYLHGPRLHRVSPGRRLTVGRAPSLTQARIPLTRTARIRSSPVEQAPRRTRASRMVGTERSPATARTSSKSAGRPHRKLVRPAPSADAPRSRGSRWPGGGSGPGFGPGTPRVRRLR